MANQTPVPPNPFGMGNTNSAASDRHGTAEPWAGTVFAAALGITPPATRANSPAGRGSSPAPTNSARNRSATASAFPRATSARRRSHAGQEERRTRERDQRQPEPRNVEQQLPTEWGARTLSSETRIEALEESMVSLTAMLDSTIGGINPKVDTMKAFVQEVEGRFGQLERALPERPHKIEKRQEQNVTVINGLATSISEKSKK